MSYWGGWLPWNRRWQTEQVSLAAAAGSTIEDFDPFIGGDTRVCKWCKEQFPGESAPWGYSRYCSQVCVDAAKRERGDQ